MEKKSLPTQFGRYGKFAIYIAILILLNLAINITPPKKIDLTSNKLFSISQASKEAVATLNEPLTIKVFISDNLPGRYNTIKPYIRDILKEYADNANKKYFNYEFLNVGGGEEVNSDKITANQNMASDYGIEAVNIQAVEKDQLSYKLSYLGMAFIHGDVIETLTPIQSTNGLEFQITSTIQKMNDKISSLLALDENIKVNLILSSNLKQLIPETEQIPATLETVIEKLNKKNYNKLDLVRIDPSNGSAQQELAAGMNAYALPLQQQEETYYADIMITTGERKERVQLLELGRTIFGNIGVSMADADTLETTINDAVSAAINITEKIGYLTSNGTLKLEEIQQDPYRQQQFQRQMEGLTNFRSIMENEYTIVDVDLSDGKPIPEGINCLIIAGAEEEFTDYQLFQIDQFLMQGKSLAVFQDPKKIVVQQNNPQLYGQQYPEFLPNRNGLDELLQHYGVELENAYIYDEGGYEQRDPQRGVYTLYDYPEIKNNKLNENIDFIKNIRGMILYAVGPLKVDSEQLKEKGINTMRLFSSTDHSWTSQELLNERSLFSVSAPSESDQQSYDLAYILEGKFESYFADKKIPEKPEPADPESGEENAEGIITLDAGELTGETQLIKEGEPGKIFMIGSSYVLHNRLFNNEISQNMLLYLNIFDYLNGKRDYAVMRTKLQQYNPLDETSAGYKAFIKIFNTWGLPTLVVLLGLLIFLQRNNRKVQIQKEFIKQIDNK